MNEDFVTYKQAVKLKELGFDWECNHYYNVDHVLCENNNEPFSIFTKDTYYENHNNDNDWSTICSAPTLAQAAKWLREKDICVTSNINIRGGKYKFNWSITLFKEGRGIWDESVIYDTYEQALSVGIDKALNLIEKGDSE